MAFPIKVALSNKAYMAKIIGGSIIAVDTNLHRNYIISHITVFLLLQSESSQLTNSWYFGLTCPSQYCLTEEMRKKVIHMLDPTDERIRLINKTNSIGQGNEQGF